MTNFIPLFPLPIVAYPGEQINLHIFEPRYKQLIQECYALKKPFGIPAIIQNQVQDYGCSVFVKNIEQVYENGEMDITTQAQDVFRILEIVKEIPDKLYSGAIVSYPHNHLPGSPQLLVQLLGLVQKLHARLDIEKKISGSHEIISSYDIAHFSSLSLEQEYALLQLMQENQRLEYLKRHITSILPALENIDRLKERVKRNGHFRSFEGFEFEK